MWLQQQNSVNVHVHLATTGVTNFPEIFSVYYGQCHMTRMSALALTACIRGSEISVLLPNTCLEKIHLIADIVHV